MVDYNVDHLAAIVWGADVIICQVLKTCWILKPLDGVR